MSTGTAQPVRQQAPAGNGTRPDRTALDSAIEATISRESITWKAADTGEEFNLSISHVRKLFANPTKTGKMPTDRDCWMFLQLCKARGLNPYVGDAFLVGYDEDDGKAKFSLITAHQALLKRAEASGKKKGMESGVIIRDKTTKEIRETPGDFVDDGDTLLGGWCKVYRKDYELPIYERVKLSTYNKGWGRWRADPAGMIVKCFDESTEVLTTNGFQKFADVSGNVYQVTDSGLEPTDSIPFVQQYDGEMIALHNQNLDFVVTPNHDMITTSGKIEAIHLFGQSRLRPKFHIPRLVQSKRLDDTQFTDDCLRLAAVFACDGIAQEGSFVVSVSRPHKIAMLERIALHHSRRTRRCTGDHATTRTGRTITTQSDKECFRYKYDLLCDIIDSSKNFNTSTIASLSPRQSRILCDTLIKFDGHVSDTGVPRFYSSRPAVLAAFEVAAVSAGFCVSPRKPRTSDGATKPNVMVAISSKLAIPVRRHGGCAKEPTLEIEHNPSGRVWCVSVPSGVIVVRRNGFSMLCGNCAEAGAHRLAFPSETGGMYLREEMDADDDDDYRPNQADLTKSKSKSDRIADELAAQFPSEPEKVEEKTKDPGKPIDQPLLPIEKDINQRVVHRAHHSTGEPSLPVSKDLADKLLKPAPVEAPAATEKPVEKPVSKPAKPVQSTKPATEPYGEKSDRWMEMMTLIKQDNQRALDAKERLGWLNTPFMQLRQTQIVALIDEIKKPLGP